MSTDNSSHEAPSPIKVIRISEPVTQEELDQVRRAAEQIEERWLDLSRLTAIKWGDKIIDPAEVVYVHRGAAS